MVCESPVGMLNQARIPLQVDIGFGDAITPAPEQVEYPVLFDAPPPLLKAYPRYTLVAEKVEAMVKLGLANSRMKDFYDIWLLSRLFSFEGSSCITENPLPPWSILMPAGV
ncbi:MAG: nucleotidyl transferase AbiEii/AbiGii toxin family protein [Desulfobacteraceae bacterium]|nr:MAG: nucleotidyl transferase AbiEii/AbiGii toxin family protein [Desulfobacteraceae bacterium]